MKSSLQSSISTEPNLRNANLPDPPNHTRRVPKQQRSRLLVESLKEACRIILETDGGLSQGGP
ncbi:MAG: hypothetical protein ABW049_13640 [Spongiibacteraceae bacterium]